MALPIAGKLLKGVAKKGGLGDLASNKLGMMLAFPTLLIVFLGDFIGKVIYWATIGIAFFGGSLGSFLDLVVFVATLGSGNIDAGTFGIQFPIGVGFGTNVIFTLIVTAISFAYVFFFLHPNNLERLFLLVAALTSMVLPFPALCITFAVILILKLMAGEKDEKNEESEDKRDEEPPRERGGLHTQMEST